MLTPTDSSGPLLRDSLRTLGEDERSKGIAIVLERAWDLLFVDELSDLVLDTIEEISRNQWRRSSTLIKRTSNILQYRQPQLSAHLRDRLQTIRSSLLGEGFSASLRLYAGTNLLDRAPGEDQHVEEVLDDLAAKAVQDPTLLTSNLAWLVTREAENGFAFGRSLAKRDSGFSLLAGILDAARAVGIEATSLFLGGYLREVSERDSALLQNVLKLVSLDDKLRHILVELTWRSGLSDASVMRLIRLAREKKVDPPELRILAFGRAVNSLSVLVFSEVVHLLLSLKSSEAAGALLDLYAFYYLHGDERKELPEELTFQVISQPALFQAVQYQPNSALDYHWAEVATSFLQRYPLKVSDVAALLF